MKRGLIEDKYNKYSQFLLEDKTYSKLKIIDEKFSKAYVVKINNCDIFSSEQKPNFDKNTTLLDLMKSPEDFEITNYIDPYIKFNIKELSKIWFNQAISIEDKDIKDFVNLKDNIALYSRLLEYNLKQIKTIDNIKLDKIDVTNLAFIVWHFPLSKISKENVWDTSFFNKKVVYYTIKQTFIDIIKKDVSWCFGGYDPSRKIRSSMILKALSIPSLHDKLKIKIYIKEKRLFKYDKLPFIYYK